MSDNEFMKKILELKKRQKVAKDKTKALDAIVKALEKSKNKKTTKK